MKICPECSHANDERFLACVRCYIPLAHVHSLRSADSNDPEGARRAWQRRAAYRQLGWAVALQVLAVTGFAMFFVSTSYPQVLALYTVAATLVALAVWRGWAGVFQAGFLQGAASAALLFYFGPVGPTSVYMLAIHGMAAVTCGRWIETIRDAGRRKTLPDVS